MTSVGELLLCRTVTALLDDGAPSVRPLERSEYDQLVRAGMFDGEKLELIKGVIVRTSPQDARHAWAIQRLTQTIVPLVGDRGAVRVQLPLAVSDDSEPAPDVAIVARADHRDEHPRTALLVVEVALSSLRFDRVTKAELYARAGVGEYWIVDLAAERIEVHAEPSSGTYTRVTTHARGATVALVALPGVAVAVDDVL